MGAPCHAEVGASSSLGGIEDLASDRESTPVDKKQALVNCDGDEELFREIVQIFLEDTPKRIEALSQAVAADDADQIQKAAHGLKGASANLAAGPLRQASQALEKAGRDGQTALAREGFRRVQHEWERLKKYLTSLRLDAMG